MAKQKTTPIDGFLRPDTPDNTDERNKKEKVFDNLMTSLTSDDSLHQKADLSKQEAHNLVKLKVFETATNSDAAGSLADWIMKYSISKGRKGRQELVQMMQQGLDDSPDKETSNLAKLFGGK